MDNLKEVSINAGESTKAYIDRMCKNRVRLGYTWDELTKIINAQCNLHYSESHYRKNWVSKQITTDECANDSINDSTNDSTKEQAKLENILEQIQRERVKLRDERTQKNADIRKISREETFAEIARECIPIIASKKYLPNYEYCGPSKGGNSAILEISDWHYGIECDNYWNKYNTEIALERINTLTNKVIDKCLQDNVSTLYVANLSDLICGRIHLPLRLQSRLDVVSQTMEVGEILSEMLVKLSEIANIQYFDCVDNHSRIEPNKENAIELESFVRFLPWYLRARLSTQIESGRISINDNIYGPDIISFNVGNFKVAGVHGNKDKPQTVVDNISMMTHEKFDLILTAHLHHFSCDEKNTTVVVSNGSLMGTDEYAKGLRLTSEPSQNLIIVSPDNVVESIDRILVAKK